MKFKNIKPTKHRKASPLKKPQQKKIGDSGKKRQFPNIYRFITERMSFRLSWRPKLSKIAFFALASISILISLVLTAGIIISAVIIYQNLNQTVQINNQRQN